MTCLAAALLALALLAPAAPSVQRVQRVADASGVHLVYVVTAPAPVAIAATGPYTVTPVQDGATWRATVTATIGACDGALWIDGVAVEQQRCTWLPVVGRAQ